MCIDERLQAYLRGGPTCATLELGPPCEEVVLRRYMGGDTVRERRYPLTGVQSIDALQTWIETEAKDRSYPILPAGRRALSLECLVIEGKQQVKLTYYQTGGRRT